MDRYSTLWGTEEAGPYNRLGSSKRLGNFLTQKIGAASVKDVVEKAEALVTGFEMLPGYENEKQAIKPLAVVYAPLYLEKILGVKGMKGFCALGISGLEHRAVRVSTFSHTWFFSRTDMLTAGEYNYLDQIFGTDLTTSQDVKLHREGDKQVDVDQLPKKVQPVLSKKDLPVVLQTIDALYQKKNVVLVLEAGVSFNSRAMELLTQIYSLMQPVLATETGFATYQTTKRILDLSAETNVQIYVVPAEANLGELPAGKFQILNAGRAAACATTPVMEVLLDWAKMDWKLRSKAMEHLFAKNNDYSNGDYFVSLSREFFAQNQNLNEWVSDTSKHKTITSMAALQAEDKTATNWKLVPWAKELFEKKYPALLTEGADVLNARNIAVAYEYDGTDGELKKRSSGAVDAAAVKSALRQFQYGRKLAAANEQELCRRIWEKADLRVGAGYREELAAKDAKYAQEKEQMEQTHQKQLQNKNDELAAKDAEFSKKETEFETAWKKRETSYQEEKNAVVDAAQKKLEEAARVHSVKIAQMHQKHEEEMTQQKAESEKTINDLQVEKQKAESNVITLRAKTHEQEGAIAALTQDKQKAENTVMKLRREKREKEETIENLEAERDQAVTDLQTMEHKVKVLRSRLKALDPDGDHDIDVPVRADENETKPRTIKVGPIELTMPVIAVIAVTAVVALLLGTLLGFVIGGAGGGKEEYALQWSVNDVPGDAAEMGEVTLSHEAAEVGETVTVKVVPAEGWKIDSVACQNGTEVTKVNDNEYTFVMPEQEETVLVHFSKVEPAVTVYEINWLVNGKSGNDAEKGSVAVDSITAEAGKQITVTVTPAEGWQIDEVKCQSGAVLTKTGDNEYGFVMPAQAETIQVRFSQIPQTLDPFNEDGTINWANLMAEVSWAQAHETEPEEMEKILGENAIKAEGWEQVGILLAEEWKEELQDTASPYILMLRRVEKADDPNSGENVEGGTAEKQLDTAALELVKKGWLVVDNGEWCLVVPAEVTDNTSYAWSQAMKASLKVMDLLNGKNDRLAVFAYQLEDERIINLQTMMSDAGMEDDWWVDLDGIHFDEDTVNAVRTKIGSGRMVVMSLKLHDGIEAGILNYVEYPERCEDMVGIAKGKGHKATHADNYVLVVLTGTVDSGDSE